MAQPSASVCRTRISCEPISGRCSANTIKSPQSFA
jgi:hypothetical protein